MNADPQGREAAVCIAYIRGFLDSAMATGALAEQSRQRHSRPETWTQRAARTRVGSRLHAGRQARQPEYCVEANLSVADVIDRLLQHMSKHPPDDETTAREVVASVLRRSFPCSDRSLRNLRSEPRPCSL